MSGTAGLSLSYSYVSSRPGAAGGGLLFPHPHWRRTATASSLRCCPLFFLFLLVLCGAAGATGPHRLVRPLLGPQPPAGSLLSPTISLLAGVGYGLQSAVSTPGSDRSLASPPPPHRGHLDWESGHIGGSIPPSHCRRLSAVGSVGWPSDRKGRATAALVWLAKDVGVERK